MARLVDAPRAPPSVRTSIEFDAETYGVALIPLIEDFVAGRGSLSGGDEAPAWAGEQEQLGSLGEYYFTYTQFCFQGTRAV